MGRLATYLLLISTIVLLFHIFGLVENTVNSDILDTLLNIDTFVLSDFIENNVLLVFSGIIGAAVGVGLFISGRPDLALTGTFSIFMFNLLMDILVVYNKLRSENPVIALIIFAPSILLLGLTIIEWWTGRD